MYLLTGGNEKALHIFGILPQNPSVLIIRKTSNKPRWGTFFRIAGQYILRLPRS